MQWSFPTLNTLAFQGSGASPVLRTLWSLKEVLDGMQAAGFRYVGLDHVSVEAFVRDGGSIGDLNRLLVERALACSDIGVLRIGVDAELTMQRACYLAELGQAIGARLCVTTFATDPTRAAVALLTACAERLHEAGIRIALEFAPYTSIRTIADARAVCQRVGWDRCGVLVDSWMFFRGKASWADLADLTADEVAAVQLSDASRIIGDLVFESRHLRVPPGEGAFDLARFVTELAVLPHLAPVSIEILSCELRHRSPAEQAAIAMRSVRRLEETTP